MTCKCGNTARYINERGELCCGTCPIAQRIDSIRLSDVPKLLAWAREYTARREHDDKRSVPVAQLQEIIGRKPQ